MSNQALRLVLLGPPGSGKGTQAHLLCSRYGIGHVSTGDILRKNTRKGTDLGRHAEALMQGGALVPDSLILAMLEDLYNRVDGAHQSFVLDGFPRSEAQARALSSFLGERAQTVHCVLQLDLDDELIVERLVHRRTCPTCGRTYHLKASPPRQEGVCDDDATPLIWRPDDHEEVIRNRLAVYHEQTQPVAAYYQGLGVLSRISALDSVDEVQRRIVEIVEPVRAALTRA